MSHYKMALKKIGAVCRTETDPMIALEKIEALVNEALEEVKP